jgi:hypothetical protein
VHGILARRWGGGADVIAAGQADDVHVHGFDRGPMPTKTFEAPRRLLVFIFRLADGLQAMLAVPVLSGYDRTYAGL